MTPPPDPITAAESPKALAELNRWLARQDAAGRIAWALENTAGNHALSSSFGAQAAVSLHMVTRQAPDLPVILVDTGYLFPETHVFIGELRERLRLNLKVFQPDPSEAWPESRTRQLERLGAEAIGQYNRVHKVEPMQRALSVLGVRTWIAGLRRDQSRSRAGIDFLELRDGRWKLHPLADWTDRDIWQYLDRHDLPYHPLWHEGYVSIGDVHTTRRLEDGMNPEETRFFGLKRECGLHFDDEPVAAEEAA
ncbi:phosphoadenylyl-sulfate reductase [Marilutibacter aestuarii]|uniref:Phosphoadenosine 5'-phosphosulfate reductase n=1 Tax=Marilutibacter aestuarii TaxID=1706195 RepID=A0A508AKR6_9GAMM|nr:phosphoadenylyl-sulfate reductase [Lysobacter aestuarii]TQD48288.1 phosphoadenylyl-sulfate reductase [Lysobacter aestuarii]